MSIQTTDPVADMLTRIRNAIAVGKTEIRVPTSKLKFAVADKLQKINYLEKVEIEEANHVAFFISLSTTKVKLLASMRLKKFQPQVAASMLASARFQKSNLVAVPF